MLFVLLLTVIDNIHMMNDDNDHGGHREDNSGHPGDCDHDGDHDDVGGNDDGDDER